MARDRHQTFDFKSVNDKEKETKKEKNVFVFVLLLMETNAYSWRYRALLKGCIANGACVLDLEFVRARMV